MAAVSGRHHSSHGSPKHSPAHRSSSTKKLVKQESRTLTLKRHPSVEGLSTFLPPECGNERVQESDGSFFESFTALSWKQENRRLRASLGEEEDNSPPDEIKFVPKPKNYRLKKDEFELLYIEVLYTIKHKIGTTAGGHSPFIHDLYLYAREAFGVTPEDHARLLAKASEEKPPILILNIHVVEAKTLEAKDVDGFSDPYCMLGIMPGKRTHSSSGDTPCSSDEEGRKKKDKDGPLKKFSQSFKRKKDRNPVVRDQLPARFIKTTSVKPDTLNPVWNEKFRFDLDDVHKDRLHLDIWDHDDESSVFDAARTLNEVQGFKGMARFFKQVAQSARTGSGNVDDFLGSVNLKLSDIPSVGVEKWYDLEGRSSRSNVEGKLKLRLSLATREDRGIPEEDNWTDIRQHEDLMGIFIDHEIRQLSDEVYKWDGTLPEAALTILHQHAIQGDITQVQQAMCRWTAYSRKHMEHPFDYSFLAKLLQDLGTAWQPGALSRDEEECLAEAFNTFIEFCLNLLRRQRETFPPVNTAAMHRLEHMLKCLAFIYQMKVFRRCCPFIKELHSEIIATVKKGTSEWYDRVHHNMKPQVMQAQEEDTLHNLTNLTNTLNTDLQKAQQSYQNYFQNIVNVDYFTLVFKQLEKLLADDVSRALEEEELGDEITKDMENMVATVEQLDEDRDHPMVSTIGPRLFELYLALQEFCSFKAHLEPAERRHLAICSYYEWYRPVVNRWLTIAKHKSMQRIKKAVELDRIGEAEIEVKHSTSAVDVCSCFGQIIEFWRKLEWPDIQGSYNFIMKITDDICHGATYYADLVHEKLKAAGYYDEEGQFDVTEQLCITINDIEQVRRALKPLPESLKYNEVCHVMEKYHGEKSGQKAKDALLNHMQMADDDMVKKIKQVVDRVADKMRPDIKKDVFHLCWAPESVPAEDGIGDLMEYLDSNLVTLNNNLLRTNFDRILESIWVEVLEEMNDVMHTEQGKSQAFYQRLHDALFILVEFFHANQKGLTMATIKSQQFKDLEYLISLCTSETSVLIEKFFVERMEEQANNESSDFGALSVRVYYNTDAEILCVEVLNAKNIIPLDANGLSDPFVMIELCPTHTFPEQTVQKTRIIKKTLHPTFDETFEFNVSSKQCKLEGALLLFTVMDHDIMFSNDFAGEAYLPLNSIPGITGDEVSGFTALTPVTIPLIQVPHKPGYGAYFALEQRDWDPEAQEFVVKRKRVEELMQDNVKN